MPINLSDGDFMPFLQYDSKAGRFFAKAEGSSERQEIERPTLAFDMASIKTGWIRYPAEGGAPEHIWDGSPTDPTQKAPRPMGEGWKRGFEVLVYSNAEIPGSGSKLALRTFGSNSFYVNSVMAGMFCEYENNAPSNPGKVPVFACKGVKAVQNQYGTIYEPVFELVQWVDAKKVPQFETHRASKQQVLPPAQGLRRISATAPAQNGQRQHVVEQRGNYALSSTTRAPVRDGLEEVLGADGSTDIGSTF